MYFSPYKVKSNTRVMQSAFYGLNKNARINDGEFSDMTNMSSDYAPLLTPRAPRVIAQNVVKGVAEETVTNEDGTTSTLQTYFYENLNGMLGDVGFAAVFGTSFYYMGEKIEGIALTDGEKNMLAMGSYILIYPDTVYYNTVSGEYGIIETGTSNTKAVTISLCESRYDTGRFNISNSTSLPCELRFSSTTINKVRFIGTEHAGGVDWCSNPTIRTGRPSSFTATGSSSVVYSYSNAMLSVDGGYLYYCSSADVTSSTTSAGYDKYTYANCKWTKIDISSFTMTSDEFTSVGFTDGDIDRIWAGNTHLEIKKNSDGEYVITNSDIANVITLPGAKIKEGDEYAPAARIDVGQWRVVNLPVFDCICVHNNRLWGCRYGNQVTNKVVNEIYCSKLGDFKTWTLSSTTATLAGDPYTMSVGDYGAFTGCISHRGQLLFFKDNIVYRVSGDKPSNFQIDKISESGLQSGCERSLEIIDEVLYYKSRNGVFAYDGSIPQKISDTLGNFYYTDAVAGKHFSKYYITMIHDGVRKLYVYDTRYKLWHAEDDADIRFFTEYNGALYGAIDNDVVCLSGAPAGIFGATEAEGAVKWSVETGDIGLDSPYQKFLRRILIRMDMDDGAKVLVELLGDDGEWYTAWKYMSPHKRSFMMPVVTPRVDHARIRISGVGGVKIYSISYETESAGDRYVESWSQQESARARKAYSDERETTRDEFWEEE